MEISQTFIRHIEENQEQDKNPSSSNTSSSTHPWAPNSSHREHMFEKVVTPSDVGKLNRLVIPKQHAERYFPLEPSTNEKGGLLLNFEENQTGKPWRFRYSYWNSSQSYVMTKGWSRFVKDKKLNSGDVVSFSRGSEGRLFIDWRRRPVPVSEIPMMRSFVPNWGWGGSIFPPPFYLHPISQVRTYDDHRILESVPVLAHQPMIEPRRQVRLFGVNIECSEHDPPSPLEWRLSSFTPPTRNNELQLMPLSRIEDENK